MHRSAGLDRTDGVIEHILNHRRRVEFRRRPYDIKKKQAYFKRGRLIRLKFAPWPKQRDFVSLAGCVLKSRA